MSAPYGVMGGAGTDADVPPTALVYVSVLTYADGTHDVEVLDGRPTESFLDGLSDLAPDMGRPGGRLIAWEVREGYVNGGDSLVLDEGVIA